MTNRVEKARDKILKLINKKGLTSRELFTLWTTLGYDIGESIHGRPETLKDLEEMYYAIPALGTAMMLQSKIALSWLEDLREDGRKENTEITEETS